MVNSSLASLLTVNHRQARYKRGITKPATNAASPSPLQTRHHQARYRRGITKPATDPASPSPLQTRHRQVRYKRGPIKAYNVLESLPLQLLQACSMCHSQPAAHTTTSNALGTRDRPARFF